MFDRRAFRPVAVYALALAGCVMAQTVYLSDLDTATYATVSTGNPVTWNPSSRVYYDQMPDPDNDGAPTGIELHSGSTYARGVSANMEHWTDIVVTYALGGAYDSVIAWVGYPDNSSSNWSEGGKVRSSNRVFDGLKRCSTESDTCLRIGAGGSVFFRGDFTVQGFLQSIGSASVYSYRAPQRLALPVGNVTTLEVRFSPDRHEPCDAPWRRSGLGTYCGQHPDGPLVRGCGWGSMIVLADAMLTPAAGSAVSGAIARQGISAPDGANRLTAASGRRNDILPDAVYELYGVSGRLLGQVSGKRLRQLARESCQLLFYRWQP